MSEYKSKQEKRKLKKAWTKWEKLDDKKRRKRQHEAPEEYDSGCSPTDAESVKEMSGCLKMDFEKFRERFSYITVCWYDAYERVMELPNEIPEKGYKIKTKKPCSDKNDVVVAVYEDFENSYVKRRQHNKAKTGQKVGLQLPVKFKPGNTLNVSYELACYNTSPESDPLLSPTNS